MSTVVTAVRPGADDHGPDSVHGAVEEIEAQVGYRQLAASHQLLEQGTDLIAQNHHMVAVPAHRSGNMEEQLIGELKQSGDLVGYRLCRVKVPHIQTDHLAPTQRIANIELV